MINISWFHRCRRTWEWGLCWSGYKFWHPSEWVLCCYTIIPLCSGVGLAITWALHLDHKNTQPAHGLAKRALLSPTTSSNAQGTSFWTGATTDLHLLLMDLGFHFAQFLCWLLRARTTAELKDHFSYFRERALKISSSWWNYDLVFLDRATRKIRQGWSRLFRQSYSNTHFSSAWTLYLSIWEQMHAHYNIPSFSIIINNSPSLYEHHRTIWKLLQTAGIRSE